jgi:Ser/Thr protein kinase RdoA (MazF antagonist)
LSEQDESEIARAIEAAVSIAAEFGLSVDDEVVLNHSNKITLRLSPSDVVARVAPPGREGLQFEVDVAQQLAAAECAVASLDPRAAPRVHEHAGFAVTLWTYYETVAPIGPAEYANALAQLHRGMRPLEFETPHYTDRIEEAHQTVADHDRSPALADADRALLLDVLERQRRVIGESGREEQLLHGEPHHGNVLGTTNGPVFIDFETCCRGPVEFDLSYVPAVVSAVYPGADQELLDDCRLLALAMVAAWRWDATDQLPGGKESGDRLLAVLRAGPPWPALETVMAPVGNARP